LTHYKNVIEIVWINGYLIIEIGICIVERRKAVVVFQISAPVDCIKKRALSRES